MDIARHFLGLLGSIFVLWPWIVVFSLSGVGFLFLSLLSPYVSQDRSPLEASNPIACAFAGLFMVTLLVLGRNFWLPLGRNAGLVTSGFGMGLFAWRFFLDPAWRKQTIYLLFSVAPFVYGWRGMTYAYDAGIYHIPYMNWLADEALPLGLANLEGRLGFNSAWLLFAGAFRVDWVSGWGHLIAIEMALAGLVLAWLAQSLRGELAHGWSCPCCFHLVALALLGMAATNLLGVITGTDASANLLAFCAWVACSRLMLGRKDGHTVPEAGSRLVLAILFSALAVTFKLAMAPILLLSLVCWVLLPDRGGIPWENRHWLALIGLYLVLWTIRGFLLTGCLAYPATSACLGVEWTVPKEIVAHVASDIMAWPRAPGPGYQRFADPMNFAWIPAWTSTFVESPLCRVILSLLAGVILIRAFMARRSLPPDEGSRVLGAWFRLSMTTSLLGILFWFYKAPDPRFSWVFFLMGAGAALTSSLATRRFGFSAIELEFKAAEGVPGAATWIVSLAAVWYGANAIRALPALVEPAFTTATTANGVTIFKPAAGDQCWTKRPCSPYSIQQLYYDAGSNPILFKSVREPSP